MQLQEREVTIIKKMASFLSNTVKLIHNEEKMLLICTGAIFLPFYLCIVPAAIALICVLLFRKDIKIYLWNWHLRWGYVFFAYAIAVAIFSRNLMGAVVTLGYFVMTVFAYFSATQMSGYIKRNIITIVCYGSVFALIVAVVQDIIRPEEAYRPTSVFVETNYYAFMCEMCAVLLVYAILHYGRRTLYYVGLASSLAGIWESGCRTAWPSVICGILIVFLCLRRYRHLIIGLIVSGVGGACVLIFKEVLLPRANMIGAEVHMRAYIWKTAISIFLTHPVFGQGMFTYSRMETKGVPDFHAHNLFLESLCNFGVVGTVFLVFCLVLVIRALIKHLRVNAACSVSLGVLTVTFVHGFMDEPVMQLQCSLFMFLMMAFSGIGRKKRDKERADNARNAASQAV